MVQRIRPQRELESAIVDLARIDEWISRECERRRERVREEQIGGMLVVERELDAGTLMEEARVDAGLEFGAALWLEIRISGAGLHDARCRAAGRRHHREWRVGAQRRARTRQTARR